MALKFRHLSVPQAKLALRHREVNSTDLTTSQSSHETARCGRPVAMTPGVTAAYNWTQFPVIADIGGGIGTRLPLSSMLLPPQNASVRQTAFESGVETR